MKKALLAAVLAVTLLCSGGAAGVHAAELSDAYITIREYEGLPIVPAEEKDATEENVDSVIRLLMRDYIRSNQLPEDAQITDEIVKELSDESSTVDEYRRELLEKIKATREKAVKEEEETRVWEKLMDNTEVKAYPEERLAEIKADLVELYEGYAAQSNKTYDEYLEMVNLTEEDLDEAAEASLKQELAANLIAGTYDLEPTEEEVDEEAERLAKEYHFTTVKLLYVALTREDVRNMLTQDIVKEWLRERCIYVEAETETGAETES